MRCVDDRLTQGFASGLASYARLRHDDEPLRPDPPIERREHRDATFPRSFERADRFFEFLRINVASRAFDQVLDAPGDEDVAPRDIAAIARLQPVAVE